MPLTGRTRSMLLASTLLGGPVAAAGAANFEAGNQTHESLYDFGAHIASFADPDTAPTAGGTLTINGQALGSYDYTIKDGNETISSFSNGDWFTTTADSRAAIIVVKGNLTINSGQVLIPSNRKLFTLVYVTGALVCEGGISMTARGANHSASGSNITAAAVRIIDGEHGGVTDPQVPAAGATGGASADGTPANGNTGGTGTAGQTGGGGSGSTTSGSVSGAGADGTAFSSGPGGGANNNGGGAATGGAAAGGAGGDAAGLGNLGGGAGNPGGAKVGTGLVGEDGTGGVLVVICLGALSGAGTIAADGKLGGAAPGGGGSSGGGSVTVLYGSDTSSITPAANGGAAAGTTRPGGAGGAGTARKLELAA